MDITAIIDRMAEIKSEEKLLKTEYDKLQAQLQTAASEDLKDTKIKSVTYTSDCGNAAQVINADKVDIISVELLREIFGKTFHDMVKEETKFTLKAPAKRILSAIWRKEYCEGSVEDVINVVECDEKTRKQLLKKVQGIDFMKDKKALMDHAGLADKAASDLAYLVSEAAAWQTISTLIKVNNNDTFTDELLNSVMLKVNAAVCVDYETKTKLIIAGCDDE